MISDVELRGLVPPAGPDGDRQFDEFDASVAEVTGASNAAAARLVAVVRRCILEGWWRTAGTHSPEHWVSARCALDRWRARRLVLIARSLGDYPATAAAFAAGRLTEDQVLAIVRFVDPAADAELAEVAGRWSVAQLRRVAVSFPKPPPLPPPASPGSPAADASGDADRPSEAEAPERADRLAFRWDADGRFTGSFDVAAPLGSLLEKALVAARGRLFVERRGHDGDTVLDDDDAVEPLRAITWPAALERLLHAGLEGLDPSSVAGRRPGDRFQAILHIDAEHPERARIHLGPALSAKARRSLTCDADLRPAFWHGGRPVSLGRRRHTVGPMLRSLIEDRDLSCRNCGSTGFLHVHHLVHWEDGGRTDDDNLCCLCPTCHRQVHAGEVRVSGDPTRPDGLVFVDRRGRPLPRPGPRPPLGAPLRAEPFLPPFRYSPEPFTCRV